jgi:1-acyl-sn-glycerol-3-phosphate acyltransferase
MAYKRGDPLINFSPVFQFLSVILETIAAVLVFSLIIFPLYSTRFENRKKLLRFKGRAVVVANHTTFLDPVTIVTTCFPRPIYQTLLEATVATPFLGTLTRLLGGVPLPPGMRGLEKIIATADTALKHRHFFHFYPEGELSLNNQKIEPFKFGAFYTASRLNVPVFPVVTIFEEGRLKPGSFFARKFPKQTVVVLDPYEPGDFVRYKENGEIDMATVEGFAEIVRARMQGEIDRRHALNPRAGTQAYYKGKAPRIKGIND